MHFVDVSHVFSTKSLEVTTVLVRWLSNSIRRWYARRRTIRILSALDDRQLRDIGVDRSEISKVVDDRVVPPAYPDRRRSGSRSGRVLDMLRVRHEHTNGRQELLGMSDYLLKDMGVTREDVYREIHKTVRRL